MPQASFCTTEADRSIIENIMLIGIAACATNLPKCFPPHTLVQTETGPRPMAQIERGEHVWSFDFAHDSCA
jgi:hypothetical protein